MTLSELADQAREHAERLLQDVELCSNRAEHIRITARANEAMNLAAELSELSQPGT